MFQQFVRSTMISCSTWTSHLGISLIFIAAFDIIISSSQYRPTYSIGYQQPNVYQSNTQTVPIGYSQQQVVQQPGVGTTYVDKTVASQNYYDPQTGQVINAKAKQEQGVYYDPY